MKRMSQMKKNHISVEPKVRNLRTSVFICGLKTVVQEPQITRMKQMAQMKKNHISVEPKGRNLRTSVFICGLKTVVTGGSSA
jgi:hypothetical protein